jgi:hypothetical protein
VEIIHMYYIPTGIIERFCLSFSVPWYTRILISTSRFATFYCCGHQCGHHFGHCCGLPRVWKTGSHDASGAEKSNSIKSNYEILRLPRPRPHLIAR